MAVRAWEQNIELSNLTDSPVYFQEPMSHHDYMVMQDQRLKALRGEFAAR